MVRWPRLATTPGCPPSRAHIPDMLILSRRRGESIVINNNVVVKVLGRDGDQIKLGIQAPVEVSVHREEIQRDIDAGKGRSPSGVASALKTIFGIQE